MELVVEAEVAPEEMVVRKTVPEAQGKVDALGEALVVQVGVLSLLKPNH